MDDDSLQRRDAAAAMIIAVIDNAEKLACLTADYLDEVVPDTHRKSRKWSSELLLELGAALKVRCWERAGIKDQVDATLPQSYEVLAALRKPLIDGLYAGNTSFAEKVQTCWWDKIAHPKSRCLNQDFALSPFSGQELLACVSRLAWNLRHLATPERE